jgi:lipopolysaccharide export system protein LptA
VIALDDGTYDPVSSYCTEIIVDPTDPDGIPPTPLSWLTGGAATGIVYQSVSGGSLDVGFTPPAGTYTYTSDAVLRPSSDNDAGNTLGDATHRWYGVYGMTGEFSTRVTTPLVGTSTAADLGLQYNSGTIGVITSTGFNPGANDTQSLGVAGTGWKYLRIQHAANQARGVELVGTLTGGGTPRIMFENTTDWAGAGNSITMKTTNALGFRTGATAGSGSGTERWYYDAAAVAPSTDNAMTNGASATRWSTVFTYAANLAGNLTFTAASAKIIPGATSLLFRNNADSADNLSIVDAGTATFRGDVLTTSDDITVGSGVTSANQAARFTINGGTNAGANDTTVKLVFNRGSSAPTNGVAELFLNTGTYQGLGVRAVSSGASLTLLTFAGTASGTPQPDTALVRVGNTTGSSGSDALEADTVEVSVVDIRHGILAGATGMSMTGLRVRTDFDTFQNNDGIVRGIHVDPTTFAPDGTINTGYGVYVDMSGVGAATAKYDFYGTGTSYLSSLSAGDIVDAAPSDADFMLMGA